MTEAKQEEKYLMVKISHFLYNEEKQVLDIFDEAMEDLQKKYEKISAGNMGSRILNHVSILTDVAYKKLKDRLETVGLMRRSDRTIRTVQEPWQNEAKEVVYGVKCCGPGCNRDAHPDFNCFCRFCGTENYRGSVEQLHQRYRDFNQKFFELQKELEKTKDDLFVAQYKARPR